MLSNSNDLHALTIDNIQRICTKTVKYVKKNSKTTKNIYHNS